MADSISGISFGQPVNILSNAISGAGLEQEQIANNIANVNTPNFRRSSTSFKDELAASIGTPAEPDVLGLKTDDSRQFAIGDAAMPQPFDPKPHVDMSTQMRQDKSNVDVDQEMAQLSTNSSYQQTMAQLLQEQYKRIREAIQEQTT